MKPVFNNTNMPLSARVSIERYFTFLSDNVGIFSVDGIYLNNAHLRVVEPKKDNPEYMDKVLDKLKEFISQINSLNYVYNINPDENNGIKGFSVLGVSTYEIECTKFNLGYGYISPYINSISVLLYSGDNYKGDIFIEVPFVLVESLNDIKVLVLPFASKLASYDKVYNIELMDMDSSFISKLVSILIHNLTPGDIIFNRILSSIPNEKYEYRDDGEKLKDVVKALGMDQRIVNVDYDDKFSYPDMPIVHIDGNDPGQFDYILCTDGLNYDKVPREEFLSSDKYKAILVRYANPNGDVYIGKISLDEKFIPLNSEIYKEETKMDLKDNKLVEEKVYRSVSESYDFPIIHGVKRVGFHSIYGFKEDEEIIKDSSMRDLYKVNSTFADKIKRFMDEANEFFRRVTKEKAKIDKGSFENGFFRGIADALLGIVTGGTLAIFLNPILAIIGGVTTFLLRRITKNILEDREYKYIRKVYARELQFFKDKLEDYQDNPNVASRIETIIEKYETDLQKLDTAYNRKLRDREAKKMEGQGEY